MIRINNINTNNDTTINFGSTQTTPETNSIFQNSDTTKINTKGLEVETEKVPPKGSRSPEHLKDAPNAKIIIAGEEKFAAIVVDLKTNRLYKYNDKGQAEIVYSVATGKKSTPTDKGIRVITNVETYPYKTAYGTKRKKNPRDYGPNVIIIDYVNTETGKSYGGNGEFIHGNNNAKSIGSYASKGCVRMDNEVIKELSKEVKKQTYVLIQ